jgi:glycosyltransferase involved in cell wall biosynthesis
MLVSVIVPLFNEEEGLEDLHADLETMTRGISALGHKVEIVFVDDGSTDGSTWQLSLLYRGRDDARILAHKKNQGFGAAMRSGIKEARGAVVLCYDGDRPYPPEDGAHLVEAVQGPEDADCATVSPWCSGGSADGVSGFRRLLSKGASFCYRVALRGRGQGLTCYTASYRAYKGDVIRSIEFRANDFLATAEVMARILLAGHRVIEMGSHLRERKTGHSKMKVLRTIRGHLGLLWRVALNRLDPDWVKPPDPPPPGADSALV